MGKIKDGGPAFPRPIGQKLNLADGEHNWEQDGMSLRDYFAAKAIEGFTANANLKIGDEDWQIQLNDHNKNASALSIAAYIIADAMLRAREADNG